MTTSTARGLHRRGLHRVPSLGGLLPREVDGRLVLDLSATAWIDPAHLVVVACLAQAHRLAGLDLTVHGPRSSDSRHYASRMHLGRVLTEIGVGHDLPLEVPARDRHLDLLEVCAIRGSDDVCGLAQLVADKVRPHGDAAAQALFTSLAELTENVPEHAQVIGYVAAQTLPQLGGVRFAVADAGPGLRASLAVRGAMTDQQALRMAVRPGVSRFDGADRGNGLPQTVHAIVAQGGSLLVASGSAQLLAHDGRRIEHTSLDPFPGTLVHGALPVPGAAANE